MLNMPEDKYTTFVRPLQYTFISEMTYYVLNPNVMLSAAVYLTKPYSINQSTSVYSTARHKLNKSGWR